ncbi:MAG: hypothetical protein P0Y53_19240 [Candidatus Pseudobacter hemicellulosilyticus]|uniref:Uncharacterized protein n=1 Tax=Candidatus Pseudobacter hemicellulosilyticus TaxID=3121375 RepID=A0AAJ6BFU3_9BACT|nr:MAG: hypothetical protein P0Y53_19240 [Pseudobacter sp.]
MEIKHFVYGKFRDLIPDFDVRIISPELPESTARNIAQRINRFSSLCTLPSQYGQNIEYIGRLYPGQPLYGYVRFFPSANNQDDHGRTMVGFYHVMVFDQQEMITLDMKPWKCRDLFIKQFDNEKIVGWDNQVWLRREDMAYFTEEARKMRLSLEHPLTGGYSQVIPPVCEATDHSVQYIATLNAYSTLEDTDSQTLIQLFNAGIVLHYPVEHAKGEGISGIAKFVTGRNALPEEFKKFDWKSLPAASIKSYVSSFRPVPDRQRLMIGPGQVIEDQEKPKVIYTTDGAQPAGDSRGSGADEKQQQPPGEYPQNRLPLWLDQKKMILIGALIACLAVIGILAWRLNSSKKDTVISSGPSAGKVAEPINKEDKIIPPAPELSIPKTPPPIAGENVSIKQYDALRNQYAEISGRLETRNGEYNKLASTHNELVKNNNFLAEQNKGLMADKARMQKESMEKQKNFDMQLGALETQIYNFPSEINKLKIHLADSIAKEYKKNMQEAKPKVIDSLKPAAGKGNPSAKPVKP